MTAVSEAVKTFPLWAKKDKKKQDAISEPAKIQPVFMNQQQPQMQPLPQFQPAPRQNQQQPYIQPAMNQPMQQQPYFAPQAQQQPVQQEVTIEDVIVDTHQRLLKMELDLQQLYGLVSQIKDRLN